MEDIKKTKRVLRIVVTPIGGGTGGHSVPLISVINQLQKQATINVLGIGQQGVIDYKQVRALFGDIKVAEVSAEKFYRYWDPRLITIPVKLILGIWQAFKLLKQFKPAVVFARGGYVSVPVAWAAALQGIPVILHETDSVLSLANRLMLPVAKKIATSFKSSLMNLKGEKFVYTGQPVREEFFVQDTRYKIQDTEYKPTILVLGSSQGSKTLNQLISKIKNTLLLSYHLIHIVGQADYPKYRGEKSSNYQVIDFTPNVAELMAQADLVISRSGGTIFELAAIGKPAILIPLPWAASDHQRHNARILEKADAAVVLDQVDLDPKVLLKTIDDLMKNPNKRQELSKNIEMFSIPEAASKIAALIRESIGY